MDITNAGEALKQVNQIFRNMTQAFKPIVNLILDFNLAYRKSKRKEKIWRCQHRHYVLSHGKHGLKRPK